MYISVYILLVFGISYTLLWISLVNEDAFKSISKIKIGMSSGLSSLNIMHSCSSPSGTEGKDMALSLVAWDIAMVWV